MLNTYITSGTTGYPQTQNLYEDMIIESIQIAGQDYYYIPRTLSTSFDQIFGEDVLSSFESHTIVEMYLSDFSGYGGESEVLSKFGMEIRDTASFLISRKRFTEVVVPILPDDRHENLKWRPCEGDLIYAPFSKSLFEIKFVEDEAPGFYQINKKYVWTLRCELAQTNNDNFDTGSGEVDDLFGINIDRLSFAILSEDGSTILTEDGGVLMSEEYVVSKPFDDTVGYGDNDAIKKEFMSIINFDSNNPFAERF